MATQLRESVRSLSTITTVTLAILALASGVYTYLGVRGLLDGSEAATFFGAVLYSTAVSVGIYAFWSFLLRLLPHIRTNQARGWLVGALFLGCAMIVAMSSWLNAAALAGSAALEQHLARTLEDYTRDLDEAHNNALAAQSLLPDIQIAAERFERLSIEENATGSLTGASGNGTVVQLLRQMSGQLRGLADEVEASRARVSSLFSQGGEHLAAMRRLVSGNGAVQPRADAFLEEAVALTGVIAALQQTSIAPAVRRAAEDLSIGFIAPEADGRSEELAARQTAVVGRVERAVSAQSKALASAADDILAREQVKPTRFVPLSTPEAVLRYAPDFLPSWAGAVSIDLLPAVLILILCVVHAVIRAENDPHLADAEMSASELMKAMRVQAQLRRARAETSPEPPDPDGDADPLPEPEPEPHVRPDIEPAAGPRLAPIRGGTREG